MFTEIKINTKLSCDKQILFSQLKNLMLSAAISRLANLVSVNKFQIGHMYYHLGNTLKCVFRKFHQEARISFFCNIYFKICHF